MIVKKRLVFILSVTMFLFNSCHDSIESKQKKTVLKNLVNLRFKTFLKEFQPLSSNAVFNTTCFDASEYKNCHQLNRELYKQFLNGYEGPALSVGYLKDTSNFYSVIYCTAAACYLPNLAVYDHSGKLLQTMLIASGCGSGMGYECEEMVKLNGGNQITTFRKEKFYECDSLGQKIFSSLEENNSKIRYTIKGSRIQVDTLGN